MDKIIIFASIIFQGEVKDLQYNAIDFKTEKECYAHMTKHDKYFSRIVDEIKKDFSPRDRLLVFGCTSKRNLIRKDQGSWN